MEVQLRTEVVVFGWKCSLGPRWWCSDERTITLTLLDIPENVVIWIRKMVGKQE